MMRRRLLRGPFVLMGFADLCDAAWGRPCPPQEMPTITPTYLGGQLLPFPCPHCGAVRPQMADQQRAAYHDPARGFFWCPACRGRYRLDGIGAPLPAPLSPGARCAPCRVTVGEASYLLDLQNGTEDLDLLEAL